MEQKSKKKIVSSFLNDQNEDGLSLLTTFVHTVIVLLGWTLYFVFLWEMIQTQIELMAIVGILILIFGVIIPLATTLWIRHNMNIFKKKGPRGAVTVDKEKFKSDLGDGIKIDANWEKLQKSSIMNIKVEKDKKTITT